MNFADWDKFFSALLGGNQNVWVIILLLLIMWLFKEIRARYIQLTDAEPIRIDKTLEIYGKVEFHLTSDEVTDRQAEEYISGHYSYFSRELFNLWEIYKKNKSSEEKEYFILKLKEEISSLQLEQSTRMDLLKKDIISYFIRFLQSFFMPAFITFITIMIMISVLFFSINLVDVDIAWYDRAISIVTFFNSCLFLLFSIVLSQIIMEKRFKHSVRYWIQLALIGIGFIINITVPYFSIIYAFVLPLFMFKQVKKMVLSSEEKRNSEKKMLLP